MYFFFFSFGVILLIGWFVLICAMSHESSDPISLNSTLNFIRVGKKGKKKIELKNQKRKKEEEN